MTSLFRRLAAHPTLRSIGIGMGMFLLCACAFAMAYWWLSLSRWMPLVYLLFFLTLFLLPLRWARPVRFTPGWLAVGSMVPYLLTVVIVKVFTAHPSHGPDFHGVYEILIPALGLIGFITWLGASAGCLYRGRRRTRELASSQSAADQELAGAEPAGWAVSLLTCVLCGAGTVGVYMVYLELMAMRPNYALYHPHDDGTWLDMIRHNTGLALLIIPGALAGAFTRVRMRWIVPGALMPYFVSKLPQYGRGEFMDSFDNFMPVGVVALLAIAGASAGCRLRRFVVRRRAGPVAIPQ